MWSTCQDRRLSPGATGPVPARFWTVGAVPENLAGEPPEGAVAAALPRRLGAFPFWRGSEGFLDTLERIYRAAQTKAMETVQEKWGRA